jgi:UPF0716 protein FxsA
MPLLLLIVFVAVPILEIAVFIQVGGLIGLWPTLAIVILTAVVGTWQLRLQGLATLARAQRQLDSGQLPTSELFDGACLLLGGALLLTPGFVTDTLGLLLFLPPLRDALRGWLGRLVATRGSVRFYGMGGGGPRRPPPGDGVIDGDYREVTPGEPEDPEDPRIGGPRP